MQDLFLSLRVVVIIRDTIDVNDGYLDYFDLSSKNAQLYKKFKIYVTE